MGKKILAIGRASNSLNQIERALKLKKYQVTSCTTDDDCIKKIKSTDFDAIVIDSEIELESKAIIKQFSKEQKPEMRIVEIRGAIEQLAGEVEAALVDN